MVAEAELARRLTTGTAVSQAPRRSLSATVKPPLGRTQRMIRRALVVSPGDPIDPSLRGLPMAGARCPPEGGTNRGDPEGAPEGSVTPQSSDYPKMFRNGIYAS